MRIETIPNIEVPFALPMFREHVQEALRKVPGVRHYALTDAQVTSLAARSAAWWERERQRQGPTASFTREQLTQFLQTVAEHIPGLVQRRPADPTKPPEWPKDPLTGKPVSIKDPTSMNLLAKHNPDLYREIKRREKSGGVLTFAQLLEDQQAAADAKLVRDLEYGEEQHGQNIFAN